MPIRAVIGALIRRMPRARGTVARWLQRHAGDAEIDFVDINGHRRTADLRDDMECQLFAGVNIGLPPDVLARVRPGAWAIDVGANIGAVTGQLANRVGNDGEVWAIEPIARNVARLRDLQERNGLTMIRILDVASGAEDGTVTLHLPPPDRSGWASAVASWNDTGQIEVAVRSIDSLVAEPGFDGPPLELLKIDVEGYEAQVIDGARATLQRFRPLLYVEFNDAIQHDAGSSSLELLARFADIGYRVADGFDASPERLDGRVVDLLLVPTT